MVKKIHFLILSLAASLAAFVSVKIYAPFSYGLKNGANEPEDSDKKLNPNLGEDLFNYGIGSPELRGIISRSVAVSGSSVACSNCHGFDGRGTSEGGFEAPQITHEVLFGSNRPGKYSSTIRLPSANYNKKSLRNLLENGVTPKGRIISQVMPRYTFTQAQYEDIYAYLLTLGNEFIPGLTDDSIVIGTYFPSSIFSITFTQIFNELIIEEFSKINNAGGIFGRRLNLKEISSLEADSEKNFGVFAIIGQNILKTVQSSLPTIELWDSPHKDSTLYRSQFQIDLPIEIQAKVASAFLCDRFRDIPELAIITNDSALSATWKHGISNEIERKSCSIKPVMIRWSELKEKGKLEGFPLNQPLPILPFLEVNELSDLLQILDTSNASQIGAIIISSQAARNASLKTLNHSKLLTIQSYSGTYQSDSFSKRITQLMEKHRFNPILIDDVYRVFIATKVMIEALKNTPRSLTRPILVRSIENLQNLHTGITPPINFSKAKHFAFDGGFITKYNPKVSNFDAISDWTKIPIY